MIVRVSWRDLRRAARLLSVATVVLAPLAGFFIEPGAMFAKGLYGALLGGAMSLIHSTRAQFALFPHEIVRLAGIAPTALLKTRPEQLLARAWANPWVPGPVVIAATGIWLCGIWLLFGGTFRDNGVAQLAFSGDGGVVAAMRGEKPDGRGRQSLWAWRAPSGEDVVEGTPVDLNGLALDTTGAFAAGFKDQFVEVWSLADPVTRVSAFAAGARVQRVTFVKLPGLIDVDIDRASRGTFRQQWNVWDAKKLSETPVTQPARRAWSVRGDEDQQELVSPDGKVHQRFKGSWWRHRSEPTVRAVSGDGQFAASGDENGRVILWDSTTGDTWWIKR